VVPAAREAFGFDAAVICFLGLEEVQGDATEAGVSAACPAAMRHSSLELTTNI